MITEAKRVVATRALRAAGFGAQEVREMLAGPKTLRDEFAGRAIPAVAQMGSLMEQEDIDALATLSYRIADAMLVARGTP